MGITRNHTYFSTVWSRLLQALLVTCFFWDGFFSPCEAHTPKPARKEDKFLIAKPVLHLYEKCSEDSPYVSEGIYGHCVQLVEKMGNGWAMVETEDGYRGYALVKNLVQEDPRWKASKRLARVCAVTGMIYSIADTEKPCLMKLPFGSRIELIEDFDTHHNRWLQVQLLNGDKAWMQRGDVEKPRTKALAEVVKLAHKFLERPYIWGGTSSKGFDCSGYVQTLCKQMGTLLPRDSRPQAASDKLVPIDGPNRPGDLLFFGEKKITHVGLYLGHGKFIHSGVKDHEPRVAISVLGESAYHLLAARKIKQVSYHATISPITEKIKKRMSYSWRESNPVPLRDLRYIQLNHWGFDGCVHDGELIVHEKVADEVVAIFKELFASQYPIEKMLLIDAYQADDALSCEDNNSSAFCSRTITSDFGEWSLHSFGLAIDLNPLFNPYQKGNKIIPVNGQQFLDRTIDCHGMIREEDPCYRAFTSRGWKWGGHWAKERGYVDYQHFYFEGLGLQ